MTLVRCGRLARRYPAPAATLLQEQHDNGDDNYEYQYGDTDEDKHG